MVPIPEAKAAITITWRVRLAPGVAGLGWCLEYAICGARRDTRTRAQTRLHLHWRRFVVLCEITVTLAFPSVVLCPQSSSSRWAFAAMALWVVAAWFIYTYWYAPDFVRDMRRAVKMRAKSERRAARHAKKEEAKRKRQGRYISRDDSESDGEQFAATNFRKESVRKRGAGKSGKRVGSELPAVVDSKQ